MKRSLPTEEGARTWHYMGTSTELTAGTRQSILKMHHTRMFCYRVNREQHTSWIWKTITQSPSGPHSNSCKANYELSDRAVYKSETNTIHLLRRTQQATGQEILADSQHSRTDTRLV